MKTFTKSSLFTYILFLSACALFVKSPTPFLSWPLKNARLSQTYAPRWNAAHQGIDLVSPKGTPVFSSHAGRVVYAGNRLSGYGKTVIVEYSPHWSTLYAHLETIHVKTGWIIQQGHQVGTVGHTGNAKGTHLHFELIYKKQPVNPMLYLP